MTSTETALDGASRAYALLQAGLLYDLVFIVALFLVRALLLGITARVISHGTADVQKKACAYATLFLCFVFFVANPSQQMDNMIRPFLVMVLVGVMVCKRAFWIGIDHAVYCSLIFCLLCIFMGDYPRRGIDRFYPARATVNGSIAMVIDAITPSPANGLPREPSGDILTALVRASSSTTGGVFGDILGFFRAGLEAKEQMERLNKIAAEEALIANMLAGGGTNVHSRMQEMSAMNELFGKGGSNAPAMPMQTSTNGERHGYMETYNVARQTIEEVNRVASNNAQIVNMLSGVGPAVGDRRQEMDALHKALLEEAKRGMIDLNPSGASLSEDQIASLREAMGATPDGGQQISEVSILGTLKAGSTNANPLEQFSAADFQKALADLRTAAAGVTEASHVASNNAAIVNMMSADETNAAAIAAKTNKLYAALMDEAMKGRLDLTGPRTQVTDKQVASIREAMAESAPPSTNTTEGASTNAPSVEPISAAQIQLALDKLRRDASPYATAVNLLSGAGANADGRGEIPSVSSPPGARAYKARGLARESTFNRLRMECRAPWGGALRAVRASTIKATARARAEAIAHPPVIVNVMTNSTSGARASTPSPYQLLSKEERAKWDAALQKIKVTGFVGSAGDVAAIVNGNLIRRGEVVFIDSGDAHYPFRLTGISKSRDCKWEPMVKPPAAAKAGPAPVTAPVIIRF